MNDLFEILKLYLFENNLPKTLDCSYAKKIKLSDIVNIINNLDHNKSKIIIENQNLGKSYCGNSRNLSKLNLNLIGIEMSIKETYKNLKSLIV
jgi:hypothetical protein